MLSDNQRRLICRLLFLLCCAAPTGWTGYAIFHRPTKQQIAREIKADLGIDVNLDTLLTPYPNVYVLQGLKFVDPEFGKLFEAAEVRIEIGSQINLVRIEHSVHLTNRGLLKFVQLINENVIRRHQTSRPWSIVFADRTIIWDANHLGRMEQQANRYLTLENLRIELVSLEDGTDASISFQVADQTVMDTLVRDNYIPPKVTAFFGRSRQDEIGLTHFLVELDTNRARLPCWLISNWVPELEALGADCHFEGYLSINPPISEPIHGSLAGRFTNIDQARFYDSMVPGSRKEGLEMMVHQCHFFHGEIRNWNVEIYDGNYRQSVPAVASFSDLNLRRAILAALPGRTDFSNDTRYR